MWVAASRAAKGRVPIEVLRSMSSTARFSPLAAFIREQGAVILDGGMGTALGDEAQKDVLWGGQLLLTDEGLKQIHTAHMGFLAAGADVIGTNSYNFSIEKLRNTDFFNTHPLRPVGDGFKMEMIQEFYAGGLLTGAVTLARQARDEFCEKSIARDSGRLRPLVAASVGPVSETGMWAGMTDPTSDFPAHGTDETALHYQRKFTALAQGQPDIYALETLPTLGEATIAVDALEANCGPEATCWVSFISWDGEHTSGGDNFADAVEAIAQRDSVVAVGINCTSPALFERMLAAAKERTHKPLVAYPNSGEIWDSRQGERSWVAGELPVLDGKHASHFHASGAQVIGGCCRVTADQIAEFRSALLNGRA